MDGYDESLITVNLPATVKLKITQKNDYSIQSFFDLGSQKLRGRAIKKVSTSRYDRPLELLIELE